MRIFIILILLLMGFESLAQNLSNRGKEFWVGYGHHQFMEPDGSPQNGQEMILYFSAEQTANVRVSINSTSYVMNYVVPAGTVIASQLIPKAGTFDCRLFSLPPSFGGTGGEGVFDRGIHIESDVPIVAYAHIFGSASSGATMLMPVETWGYTYISVNSPQVYAANCFSWLYVVAKENNTRIEITPSVPTRNGRVAGTPFQVDLQKGQIYQVVGARLSGSTGHELTGSKVVSVANAAGQCYPVAVFSGSSRTAITCPPGGGGSGDNNMQQIFPYQAWGKRYLTAPTSNASSPNGSTFHTNLYKVAVKDPTTVVKRNGTVLTGLVNNLYYEYQSSTADYIEADKPVMVAQFMSSSGACGNSGHGDPEMIYLSPMEQGIKRVGFYRNTRENIASNYLTLIIPTSGVSSLRVDGTSAFSHTYPHPNLPGYTVAIKRWSPSSQAQCIVQSDSAFTAITYGLGSVESYGYNAGTLINNLAAATFIHNEADPTAPSHQYTCRNTPVEISMLVAYKPNKIVWRLSQVPSMVPNTDVTDLNPQLVDSTLLPNGLKYYKYRLPGTYMFTQTGTFEIPVRNTHPALENCNNTEEVLLPITVKAQPTADFSAVFSGCIADTVQFNSSLNSGNGYTISKWLWTYPDGSTDTIQNPLKLFTTAGVKPIKLKVTSSEGCIGDTTKDITIYEKPVTTFGITPAVICEGGTVTFTDTSSYGGSSPITNWYWDLGNGNIVNSDNAGPQTLAYTAAGPVTVRHAVRVGNACTSDTVSKSFTVFAKPILGFNYPAGCLPVDGVVQFTSTTTVTDGQTLTAYNWNFGDPNATPGNPNTSTLPNPTHMYSAYGSYDIQYSVTTSNGCTKDTLFAATFNLRPTFSYPALPTVCENAPVISVATAQVTNGVAGTGIYKGPGTDAAGNFNPTVAGFGTHTIWYVFNSTGGCRDSISQNILVRAKPVVSFTHTTGCLPTDGLAQFTNGTTIADGQTLSYAWNFDDANATPGNPNTSTLANPTHNFKEGTYNIKLVTTTANGCSDSVTVPVTFSVRPLLTFGFLPSVCQSINGTVSVAAASVTNGVTGTGVYSGPGVDAAGNFNPSLAGPGTHAVQYTFTSAGGCQATISGSIKVSPKPLASFTTTANICEGQSATITDNSTIPSGSIVTWNWDFGNGNTAVYNTNTPFNVTYSNYYNYTVKLVAVSDSSCTSDTISRVVAVHPLPKADFNPPVAVCMPQGNAVFTNTSSVPGNGSLTYQWNFGDGSLASSQKDPVHVYSSSGPFNVRLTAITAFGCTHETVKTLTSFYNKPFAAFAVSPDTLCQGTDNVFTDLSGPADSIRTWNWSFGDGSSSSSANPVKRYTLPGSYDVTLRVTSLAGCVSDPVNQQVIVYLQPVIDAGPSFTVPQGTVIQLNAKAYDPNLSFTWTPAGDLDDPLALNPTLTAMRDQTYTLTATGLGNCSATDVVTVKILKPVRVPNAFSPNGDGVNDTWVLMNLSDYAGATVEVYNRYGQVVHRSAGNGAPWDGKFKGTPLPVTTYYYIINLKNGFPPMTGSVTIVR